uniref:Uncharacterized protein n=1 Tax=Davidia involucrata TaxID=16924 RepID=A0A5B7BG02_DAVIN
MSASCCHALSHRPSLLSPPIYRVRALKLSKTPLPLNWTSLIVNSLSRSSENKWRFSCFRREDSSSEFLEFECEEEKLADDSVNPKFNQPNVVKDDWVSNLRKNVVTKKSATRCW